MIANKTQVQRNLINILGYKTKRKLVIFESDDWGSIRMPSKFSFESLEGKGAINVNDAYARFDSIENNKDIEELMTLLGGYRDNAGRHPIFTLNFIMANPHFQKIRDSDFTKYYYETFTETYCSLPNREKVFELLQQGISEKCFDVEMHGREHVNIQRWFSHLKQGNKNAKLAFDLNSFYFKTDSFISNGKSIFAALDFDTKENQEVIIESLEEAKEIFLDKFNKQPLSFIAPNYIWSPDIEVNLKKLGFLVLQGTKFQNIPKPTTPSYKRRFRYTGLKTNCGLRNTVRNCFFEPSSNVNKIGIVEGTLNQIENAFLWKTPAIISTHRLNYMGSLNVENRELNLKMLGGLLRNIIEEWPDVEFISSTDLAKLLHGKQ